MVNVNKETIPLPRFTKLLQCSVIFFDFFFKKKTALVLVVQYCMYTVWIGLSNKLTMILFLVRHDVDQQRDTLCIIITLITIIIMALFFY